VTLTFDFVTLPAGDVCLHTLDFVGGHPGGLVDGEGPEQPVLDGLVNLSGCHAEGLAGLGDGVGTKARHGRFLPLLPLQLSHQPLGTRGRPEGEPGLDDPLGLRDRRSRSAAWIGASASKARKSVATSRMAATEGEALSDFIVNYEP
jgi:hypothetical protein